MIGPGHVFYLFGSSTLVKNDRLDYMESEAKAKILIFISVIEITQVFTILLLLIRIRFKCT